jgi:hypothetical protein
LVLSVATGYANTSDAQPSTRMKPMKDYGLGKSILTQSLKQAEDLGEWK